MEATRVVNIGDHKNWKAEGGVYIGRRFRGQKESVVANPFVIRQFHPKKKGLEYMDRDDVVDLYTEMFYKRIETDPDFKTEVLKLQGKTLVCFCAPKRCHGDVIAEYLERLKAE